MSSVKSESFSPPTSFDFLPSSPSMDSVQSKTLSEPTALLEQSCSTSHDGDSIRSRSISISPDSVSSLIRTLVLAHDNDNDNDAISSLVDICANAHPQQFSTLLQTPTIEGHTPLYCAIMNNQKEALSAFMDKISLSEIPISSECTADMRLACMATNNHSLFALLHLGTVNVKDESMKRILNCAPDEIQVDEKDTGKADEHLVLVSFRITKFQKRLRTTHDVKFEFIAGGRIWWINFYLGPRFKWCIACGISAPSLPVDPTVVLRIEAHKTKGKHGTGPGLQQPLLQRLDLVRKSYFFTETLMPSSCETQTSARVGESDGTNSTATVTAGADTDTKNDIWWVLGDWVMYDNTIYVDGDGALHGKLEITTRN